MGLFGDHVNVVLSKLRADPVVALSDDTTTEAYRAQIAVNRAVRRIWNFKQWNFRRRSTTFSTVDDQTDYPLDRRIGQPYSILSSVAPYRLKIISRFNLDKVDPQRSMTGNPRIAAISDIVPVVNQPAAATVIEVVSSGAADTTQKVLVKGLVGGEEDYEELSLNGVTSVYTTKSFSSITSISKSAATAGRVAVKVGSTTLVTLGPLDKTVLLRVLTLYPVPQSVITITVRHFAPPPAFFTNFYEPVMVPEDWDHVVDQWAFLMALQAKGQDQSEEFKTQLIVASKMLEEDMATEERDVSDDPILIEDAGSQGGGGQWGVPTGHGVMEG